MDIVFSIGINVSLYLKYIIVCDLLINSDKWLNILSMGRKDRTQK